VNDLGPRVEVGQPAFQTVLLVVSHREMAGMDFTVAYKGRSSLATSAAGMSLSFAPNLRRDRVSFVGDLRLPLRFREAVSALHAIVVSDLKYKAKDRSAYQAHLKRVQERESAIRRLAFQKASEQLRAAEPRQWRCPTFRGDCAETLRTADRRASPNSCRRHRFWLSGFAPRVSQCTGGRPLAAPSSAGQS
jgi:hypothetical protein